MTWISVAIYDDGGSQIDCIEVEVIDEGPVLVAPLDFQKALDAIKTAARKVRES